MLWNNSSVCCVNYAVIPLTNKMTGIAGKAKEGGKTRLRTLERRRVDSERSSGDTGKSRHDGGQVKPGAT